MYPKGPVTRGGLTDRYLSDYPNMFGDMSAGSGLNALTRDEDFARDFIARHQDKLIYGSDCSDHVGSGSAVQGAQTIAAIRRLSPSKTVEAKAPVREREETVSRVTETGRRLKSKIRRSEDPKKKRRREEEKMNGRFRLAGLRFAQSSVTMI